MNQPTVALVLALLVADTTSVNVAQGQLPLHAAEDTVLRPVPQQFDPSKFDSVTALSLRTILDSASVRGLPTSPLIKLALQGAARRAVGSKIIGTVRAHFSAMEDAQRIMGARSSTAEIDACANAMRAGVDGGTISLLREARPGSTIIMPCVIMSDLIGRGVPFAMANNAVVSVSRLSRSDEGLDAMQKLVAKNSVRGGPTMAVEALQRYLRETVPANGRSP